MSIQGDSLAGFHNRYDSGAAYIRDISFIGEQHNFDRALSRSDNDNHALGACYNDYETEIVAGNTFDYPALHGRSSGAVRLVALPCHRSYTRQAALDRRGARRVGI